MTGEWKKQLQQFLQCDIRSLYPLARSLNRSFYFYVGPTNSGKTYEAMQKLKQADCGLYLAPLRLMALEGYERLKEEGIDVSLITGEEQIIHEEATFVCSTIEMVDFEMDVDVCIIDEVQMLADNQRGWAWVNAIIGIPAKTVILTGSVNALDAIKKMLLYLQEPLDIVKFKRKTPLHLLDKPTPIKRIHKGTALIVFSRKDVLLYKQRLSKYYKVSVIYGNLSAEVRRNEAKRFREGKSDILIATDAIAMGLNLPIKTILFTTHTKFDGEKSRRITATEIIQIAGRAGRFGLYKEGFVGAISATILRHVTKEFHSPVKTIKGPFYVKANLEQIESLSLFLQTQSLTKILDFFAKNMSFEGPFKASSIDTMLNIAKIVDRQKALSLNQKYLLSQAPLSEKSRLIKQAFDRYINAIIHNQVIAYKPSIRHFQKPLLERELLLLEDEVKKISLYLWLCYKFPDNFIDNPNVKQTQIRFNQLIQTTLKKKLISERKRVNKRYKQ